MAKTNKPFPTRGFAFSLVGLLVALFFVIKKILGRGVPWRPSGRASRAHTATVRTRRSARITLLAYVTTLYSLVTIAFLGLMAAQGKGESVDSMGMVSAQTVRLFSPVLAGLFARYVPEFLAKYFGCFVESFPALGASEDERVGDYFLRLWVDWHSQWRILLLSFLLPSIAGILAYILTAMTRLTIHLVNWQFVQDVVAPRLGLASMPWSVQLSIYLVYAVFLGPFWDITCPSEDDFGSSTGGGDWLGTSWFLLAFVEEFGWSGLVFPTAQRAFAGPRSFTCSFLATSAVWVSWHVPFIVAGSSCCTGLIPSAATYEPGAPGTPLPWALTGFTVDLLLARYIMCVLQDVCGNIWPCVLFHATHNMIIESLFVQLLAPNPDHPKVFDYFVGESGGYQILTYGGLAWSIGHWRWAAGLQPLQPITVDLRSFQ